MGGKFDSNSATTVNRAALNDKYAKYNLEDWIFSHIPLFDGMRVLDLGCGGGKQLFGLADRLSPDSSLLGIDISGEAVAIVNGQSKDRPNVEARQMGYEDTLRLLSGERFDLIVSTYAIYYAKNMVEFLSGLRDLLGEGGVLFACGPGQGTNRELIGLVNAHAHDENNRLENIEDFIGADSIEAAGRFFAHASTVRLENCIDFPSSDLLMSWWRSHNSYRADIEEMIVREVDEIIRRNGHFRLSKPVLGIRLDA